MSSTTALNRLRRHPAALLAIGAVALRLLLFLGRGDYVAFDEGWYLLLGRNLLEGEGYRLSGLRHVALSPLFPVLAGALDRVIGDPVWAGRIVAAVASGLLVVPCWSIFRRLAGRRTALLACAFVAVMPSLAPFVAAYWVGADLWVGAEPLLHLFLYSGIALVLRGLERRAALDWTLAGAAFALGYLARPEAALAGALVAAAAVAVWLFRRRPARAVAHGALLGLAFALVAVPYWSYLHDVVGRWTLTGRGVDVGTVAESVTGGDAGGGPARVIERMLWQDDPEYVRNLYALDATGTRLRSAYWGVPDPEPGETSPASPPRADSPDGEDGAGPAGTALAEAAPAGDGEAGGAAGPTTDRRGPGRLVLLRDALRRLVPVYLWPLLIVGLVAPGERRRRELIVVGPLAVTSVVILQAVAIDPRTQLFIVPLLAFYVARGARWLGVLAQRGLARRGMVLRRRFVPGLIAAVALLFLFGTDVRRLYLSLTLGSPHHVVGAENHRMGRALRARVPAGEAVMSFHPAIALFADRDWRVLPRASFAEIVAHARATGCEFVVFSAYYPSPSVIEQVPGEYLLLRVPRDLDGAGPWRIELVERGDGYSVGVLRAA